MFTVIIKYTFYIGLFLLVAIGSMVFCRRKNRAEEELASLKNYFQTVEATLNSVRYGNLAKKIDMDLYPDYSALTRTINRMIETLNDREQMLYESQTELRNQNKFLQASINSLSDGIAIIDHEGTIINASNNMYRWFDVDVLRGKNILEFINLLDDVNLFDLNNHEISIKSNVELSFLADCNKLELEDGKERYVLVLKNISDQKEIETLKEDFVATLTHDLKTPTNAQLQAANLLLSGILGDLSEEQKEIITQMKSSCNYMNELIFTILDSYQYESGETKIIPERFDLVKLVQTITESLSNLLSVKEQQIRIYPDKKEIYIIADKFQIKRVIVNFLGNAITYGFKNSIINISIKDQTSSICFNVRNKSEYIPQDKLKEIFEKYKHNSDAKYQKTATGLGLYLSKQIIDAHNGKVYAKSDKNQTCDFGFELPKKAHYITNNNLSSSKPIHSDKILKPIQ